jgi:hypothetical protein
MAHENDRLRERRAGKYPYYIAQPSIPYAWAIAQGKIQGHNNVNKFGYNAAVGAIAETVWTVGGRYVYETAASIPNIVSTDAEDGAGGATGALTVQIYGLDQKYEEQNEIITMNGLTNVPAANKYIRLNRIVVRSAGSAAGNVGIITAKDATDTRTMAAVQIGDNQTLVSTWTVPAGHEGHITTFWSGSATAKASIVDLLVRPFGEVFQVKRRILLNSSYEHIVFDFTEQVEAKSDIEIIALTVGGGGAVSAGFDCMYDLT